MKNTIKNVKSSLRRILFARSASQRVASAGQPKSTTRPEEAAKSMMSVYGFRSAGDAMTGSTGGQTKDTDQDGQEITVGFNSRYHNPEEPLDAWMKEEGFYD